MKKAIRWVQTPNAVAGVRGTRFSARVEADGASVFSSVEGSVDVKATGIGSPRFVSWGDHMLLDTVTLEAGQQTIVLAFLPQPP